MNNFEEIKASIVSRIKHGDSTRIASMAGVTQPVYRTAMMKTDWQDLTKSEKKVIDAAIRMLNRRDEMDRRQAQRIAEKAISR